MKFFILPVIALFLAIPALAQNSLVATIRDKETKEPLAGATISIQGSSLGSASDQNGHLQLKNIPNGKCVIIIRLVGYEEQTENLTFPFLQMEPLAIFLTPAEEEMEEVVVMATRSSRTIEDTPTRLEAISGEELEEKGNMKPGDIRMMLNESTGIQTQQTSATSYNSSIRIQGLDGKYTQILRDGLPLYSGFSGGLGLLQIVPLDLKQVEVIKGASSTLYGGGAIAGLVNLVSRMPKEERELNFLLNGTSAAGFDASGFYARKFKKIGTTIFASYNSGNPYDPAGIGFTAIPKYRRATLNPRVYFYANPKTTIHFGFNSTLEDRTGGDMRYIEGKGDNLHSYFENNRTRRYSTQFGVDHQLNDSAQFRLKNSFSYYDRKIEIPDFVFSGVQFSSYSEATYAIKKEKLEWVIGANLWSERFTQDKTNNAGVVDYNHVTLGGFVQNTWTASDLLSVETGLRGDYQNEYGLFLLPRIAALFKFHPKLSARLGGGLGYKTPTVFTEDAERLQFRNVLPIDVENARAEQSVGGNLDLNYRTSITAEMSFSLNSLLFYTKISNPLVLTQVQNGFYEFLQPKGYIDTKGLEANAKLTYKNFKLFVGYTLADVHQQKENSYSAFPLVARHRLNNVLMYELEEQLKIGLEAYYYSKQKLNDGSTGQAYWIFGLMAEKLWEHFSLFVNFENLTDTRQTKFGPIFTGSVSNPVFKDIYAPVDGFVVNGGIKIKL